MDFFTKTFWSDVLCKIVQALISVKVWVLIATFLIAARIINIAVTYSQWGLISNVVTLVTTVVGVVVVMREGFKLSSLKQGKDETKKPAV